MGLREIWSRFRLRGHPGANPRYNGKGFRYHERSRWIPHQGKREMARRVRQMERRNG